MENREKIKNKKNIKKEPKEKPKNILYCKIVCTAKKSRFKPSLKHTRVRKGTNVYPLELNEYKKESYEKEYVCPNCLGPMVLTVKSEKAGSLIYKLTIILFVLIFILVNALLLENPNLTPFGFNVLEINAIILGGLIIVLVVELLNNYLKTRSKRAIRLKIKAESKMDHKLYKSKRTKLTKKALRNLRT